VNQGYEQLLLQRLFQTDSTGWTHAVYVAAMFAVIMWRKEIVVNWPLFRTSYLLFAASLVIPPIMVPVMQWLASGVMIQGRGASEGQILLSFLIIGTGPALFAGAVVCGLGSMMPRQYRFAPPPAPPQPQPHPLD
jgi:hypothetical protein